MVQVEGLEGGEFSDFGRDAADHAVRAGDFQLRDPAGSTMDTSLACAAVGRVGYPRGEVGGVAEGLLDEEESTVLVVFVTDCCHGCWHGRHYNGSNGRKDYGEEEGLVALGEGSHGRLIL